MSRAYLPLDSVSTDRPLDLVTYPDVVKASNPTREVNQNTDIALVNQVPEVEVTDLMFNEDQTPLNSALEKSTNPNNIANLVNEGEDVDKIVHNLEQQVLKTKDAQQDLMWEDALIRDDPRYNQIEQTILRRQQRAMEILSTMYQENEKGIGGLVLDFIDREILRYIPLGLIEDLQRHNEAGGRELAALLGDTTISDAQWEQQFQKYADDVNSEGFLRSENMFALGDLMERATNAGYDVNATFDQVFAGTAAFELIFPALKAGKSISRISALRGVEKATEAASDMTTVVRTSDPEAAIETLPTALDGAETGSNTINITGSQVVPARNSLIDEITDMRKKGSFGRAVPQEVFERARQEIIDDVAAVTGRSVANLDIQDADFSPVGLGEMGVNINIGVKATGKPFNPKARSAADKLAEQYRDQGFSAQTVPVNGDGTKSGWYVQVSQRVSTGNEVQDAFKPFHGIRQAVANILGSQRRVQSDLMSELSYLGEGAQSQMRNAVEPMLKTVRSLPVQNQKVVSGILTELRDGSDSSVRDFYTKTEFNTKFRQLHPDGAAATEKDYEAFLALKDINDTAYFLQANRLMKRAVDRGYKNIELEEAYTTNARPATQVEEGTEIWDVATGRVVKKSELDPEQVIWRSDEDFNNTRHFVNPRQVRELNYNDVLGYNAGGRRANPDLNYFIVTGDGKGRTLLGTFSNKQAKRAQLELSNIRAAILAGKLDDAVIQANNHWNPNIQDVADFDDLVGKKGWDFTEEINIKARDSVVENDTAMSGLDYATYSAAQRKRNDDVLLEYGGFETRNHDPIKAIVQQYANASNEYSLRNYNQAAKISWLKKAGYRAQLDAGKDVDQLFNDAVVGDQFTPTTKRQLIALRNTIQTRNGVQGPMAEFMQDYRQAMSEWIFDTTGKKVQIGGVTDNLMRLGFQSAFGFFNVSQFILQASHVTSIIALSPRAGAKAAASVPAMRLALKAGGEGSENLAKFLGMSSDEMAESLEYIRISGRDNIYNDDVVKGTGVSFDSNFYEGHDLRATTWNKVHAAGTKALRGAASVSTLPFAEGERMTRWTSMITAIREYQIANKGKSILTDDARAWIAMRDQELTFNMTNASRGAWQSGAMRLPMQWMTYSFRAMETLFGKGLSWKERARLASVLALQGGLYGLGASKAADYIADQFGVAPDGNVYVALKYGAVDGILSWGLSELTNSQVRTAFGTRMAPLSGLFDWFKKAQEGTFAEVVGGPSGQIVFGGAEKLVDALGNLYEGNYELAKSDIYQFARTPSGLNNILTATAIYNTGTYRSKSGRAMFGEWTVTDAMLQAAGVTNFKSVEYYNRSSIFWKNDQKVKQWRKEIMNYASQAFDFAEQGDVDRASTMLNEISAMIEGSGLSLSDKMKLRGAIRQSRKNEDLLLILRELQESNPFGVHVIDSLRSN